MAAIVADVVRLRDKVFPNHEPIPNGTMRWFMHTALWRRFNGIPSPWYYELLERAFEEMRRQYNRPYARLEFRKDTGKRDPAIINLTSIDSIEVLIKYLGVAHYDTLEREAQPPAPIGYHRAHVKPVSRNGEGPTVLIPALLNQSLGVTELEMPPAVD